jgi:hypothetical protein
MVSAGARVVLAAETVAADSSINSINDGSAEHRAQYNEDLLQALSPHFCTG